MLMVAFAVTATAEEPELYSDADKMTYYEGGYGAMPSRYQCNVKLADGGYGAHLCMAYGDYVSRWQDLGELMGFKVEYFHG